MPPSSHRFGTKALNALPVCGSPPVPSAIAYGNALDYSSCGTSLFLHSHAVVHGDFEVQACAGPLIQIRRVALSFRHPSRMAVKSS